jgi:hypothetical protein
MSDLQDLVNPDDYARLFPEQTLGEWFVERCARERAAREERERARAEAESYRRRNQEIFTQIGLKPPKGN